MNLKKLVASLLLFTQATNAFAIGQAATQVYADKVKSVTGTGVVNVNTSGTVTVPNITDTLAGITSPTISNPTFTGTTTAAAANFTGSTLMGAAGAADAKSILEIQSTTKGFLPPRMTTAQKNAIVAPTTGLVLYDSDLKSIQVYNGTSWVTAGSGGLSYAADTGAANAYAIAPTPAALAYTTGDTYIFKATNANTTASTLNVSALGVKNIKTPQVANLPANAILANAIVMVVYDGTQFQIISQQDPSRVSPLTTKGDVHTFSTVDARVAVPGDYGRMVPDSNATTGWRPASYTQFQNGAPTKNYVQYSDFENNATTGWTATGCATVTAGLCASVGSGAAAFSSSNGGRSKGANTSSPAIDSGSNVAGTYAMNLATTAAGTIGDGYVSSAYTIDPADRGKALSYSISYKVASGTPVQLGGSTDTYAVGAYDPANNAWLVVYNPFSITKSSGAGSATGLVQTLSTTSSIQLFVYSPVAPTGASSLLFDDVNIGTQLMATGPPMTDATSFTPTGTWIANSTYTGWWWRDGDKLSMRVKIALTGAPTAATLTVTLPNSLVIDTTKLPATPTSHAFPSQMSGQGAAHTFVGSIVYASTTAVGVQSYQDGFNAAVMTLGATNATSPYTFANGDFIYFEVHGIPIVGWSSNMAMQSNTNNGITIQSFTGTGTYTLPPGVKYIEVYAVGAGGGGGGEGGAPTSGGAGVDTTFGSVITAKGGSGGNTGGQGGAGGVVGTITSPAVKIYNAVGTAGGATGANVGGGDGGSGAGSCYGGGGLGAFGNTAGGAGQANTGGGGGGAGLTAASGGGGGGAGNCLAAVIVNPAATYAVTINATGGAAGTGTNAGGIGGTGYVVVKEYYIPLGSVGLEGDKPYVFARRASSDQVIVSSGTVIWNTQTEDRYSMLNTSTGVITANRAGVWQISYETEMSAITAGTSASCLLRQNSSGFVTSFAAAIPASTTIFVCTGSTARRLAVGDTIDVVATGDASFNIDSNGTTSTISMVYQGP